MDAEYILERQLIGTVMDWMWEMRRKYGENEIKNEQEG